MTDPVYNLDGTRKEYDAVDPVAPTQTPVLHNTPRVTNDMGTAGVPGFPDTFQGPRNKTYLDFLARQTSRLRGTNAYYYVLRSQTQRLDGDQPLADKAGLDEFAPRGTAGGHRQDDQAAGIAAMYGEPVIVGPRNGSTSREITPSWEWADPIPVRAVLQNPTRSENPDERGSVYTKGLRAGLARVLCEQEWDFVPQIGDVIRVTGILGGYFDVEEVERNETRFGATGFFTEYGLTLVRSSKYVPERKIPVQLERDEPNPAV